MFLQNQNQLRSIEWGVTYLWDLKILDPRLSKTPFFEWFPADTISITKRSSSTYNVSTPQFATVIPESHEFGDLNITAYDSMNLDLKKWYEELIHEIYGDPVAVMCLEDSLIDIHVIMKDAQYNIIESVMYTCLPTGEVKYSGESGKGELIKHDFTFKIMNMKNIPIQGNNI